MSLMFIICLVGCSTDEYENLEWTNNEAIYVNINDVYREDVLSNLSMNFKEYDYKKIYVVGKETYEDGRVEYQLLFVLNCDLESFSVCKDLPSESLDNRK